MDRALAERTAADNGGAIKREILAAPVELSRPAIACCSSSGCLQPGFPELCC